MWGNKGVEHSVGLFPGRKVIGPLFLMAVTPLAAILFVYANDQLEGSIMALGRMLLANPTQTIKDAFRVPSWETVYFLAAFSAFEIFLQQCVPGKRHEGPVTPAGHVPVYKANGMQCFLITLAVFVLGPHLGLPFKHTIIYDLYAEMISFLCIFSFFFCAWLTIKGLYFPSGPDSGTNGNIVSDFWWGTELYPRIGSWDVKLFTNCRFGLMLWVLAPLSFAAAQARDNLAKGIDTDDFHYKGVSHAMIVNVVIQLVYLAKFYWWETGYMNSIDIMHDRAGYYICWGCLVWVPSVYICHSFYLVKNAPPLALPWAAAILIAGYIAVWINYDADRQRVLARKTNGNCTIWGKPAGIMRVKYVTEKGETKDSLLLTTGWWGVARHFHYIPELAAAFLWASPAGGILSGEFTFLPYFYFFFLTCLLADRGMRDVVRCRDKYNNVHGNFYDEYVKKVPYIFIPYVF